MPAIPSGAREAGIHYCFELLFQTKDKKPICCRKTLDASLRWHDNIAGIRCMIVGGRERLRNAELLRLRDNIDEIDSKILKLVEKRLKAAREIGIIKHRKNIPTRNFEREKECIDNAERQGRALNIPVKTSKAIINCLIEASLEVQEQDKLAQANTKAKSALIIGGNGRMGRWFSQFLATQGINVTIVDIYDNFRTAPLDFDFIIVATPLSQTNEILEFLATKKPNGIVFDIASLKSPLKSGLSNLIKCGVDATSIHPMFGPDTKLLSDKHVFAIDLGSKRALDEATALFSNTMASIEVMTLAEHDHIVAYLLGLSHAINIAFFTVLKKSGQDIPKLEKLSSTTFKDQLTVASKVAHENAALYYEIQALNEMGDKPLAYLEDAVKHIRKIVSDKNKPAFLQLMTEGLDYIQQRSKADQNISQITSTHNQYAS